MVGTSFVLKFKQKSDVMLHYVMGPSDVFPLAQRQSLENESES